MEAVRKHDATTWSHSFLTQLERIRSSEEPSSWRSPEPIRAALERLQHATTGRSKLPKPKIVSGTTAA
jgi:hypothetical protein